MLLVGEFHTDLCTKSFAWGQQRCEETFSVSIKFDQSGGSLQEQK